MNLPKRGEGYSHVLPGAWTKPSIQLSNSGRDKNLIFEFSIIRTKFPTAFDHWTLQK